MRAFLRQQTKAGVEPDIARAILGTVAAMLRAYDPTNRDVLTITAKIIRNLRDDGIV